MVLAEELIFNGEYSNYWIDLKRGGTRGEDKVSYLFLDKSLYMEIRNVGQHLL